MGAFGNLTILLEKLSEYKLAVLVKKAPIPPGVTNEKPSMT
jgi:hypothetical protein